MVSFRFSCRRFLRILTLGAGEELKLLPGFPLVAYALSPGPIYGLTCQGTQALVQGFSAFLKYTPAQYSPYPKLHWASSA